MSRNLRRAVDGSKYIRHLAAARGSTADSAADATSDVDNIGDDEDSCFITKTIGSHDLDNIADDIKARPEAEDASISSDEGSEVKAF